MQFFKILGHILRYRLTDKGMGQKEESKGQGAIGYGREVCVWSIWNKVKMYFLPMDGVDLTIIKIGMFWT